MKNYCFFFLISLLVAACQDDDIPTPPISLCDDSIIVDSDLFANAPADILSIISVTLESDCLNIEFSSTGCDGTEWITQLLDANEIMESLPVQKNIRLSLDNDEVCDFNPIVQISFDLTEARVEHENEIIFNLEGWDEGINYVY